MTGQCSGTTKQGKRCQAPAEHGFPTCPHHHFSYPVEVR